MNLNYIVECDKNLRWGSVLLRMESTSSPPVFLALQFLTPLLLITLRCPWKMTRAFVELSALPELNVSLLWCHLNLLVDDAFRGRVSSQCHWVTEVAATYCPLWLHQTRSGNERRPLSKHWHPSGVGNKTILKGTESWASPAEFVIGFCVEGWNCESYKYEGNCQSSSEDRLYNQRGGRQNKKKISWRVGLSGS